MNYKKLFSTILLSAALSLQASAYTVTTVAEAPQWQIDWSYNQTRPDWQEPVAENFENWTVMLVKIEEALLPYVSKNDLLAIFIDDELRGMSRPAVIVSTGEVDATQYLLKVFGNENLGDEVTLTMKYYNAQLGQVFSLSVTMTLDEDVLYGFDEDFIPSFTLGSEKYPVVTTLNVVSILDTENITPSEGDIVAAFVGDECRGVMSATDGQDLTVYLREADEKVILKYYDATTGNVFTFDNGGNPTSIDMLEQAESGKVLVRTYYYDAQGRLTDGNHRGICIRRKVYSDGSSKTEKFFRVDKKSFNNP